MEAVRETTIWQGISRQPNHIYLLEGDRVLAYIKWGEGKPEYLSGKIKIDRRGRKFVKSDLSLFKEATLKKDDNIIEVKGSKGDTYLVNVLEKTCTCQGFNFRGACKHVSEYAK